MTQPGWYPDPRGGDGQRWWDGQQWTQHRQPAPAPPPPPTPQQGGLDDLFGAEPPPRWPSETYGSQVVEAPVHYVAPAPAYVPGPVLDVLLDGGHLRADGEAISCAGRSLPMAHVEWMAYWQAEDGRWFFVVGRYPVETGPYVEVIVDRRHNEDVWRQLLDLSAHYLEPRLAGEIASFVAEEGEPVEFGEFSVRPGGVSDGRASLSWRSVVGAEISDGRVWIKQTGGTKILYVPQHVPNAVLLPTLVTAIKQATGR